MTSCDVLHDAKQKQKKNVNKLSRVRSTGNHPSLRIKECFNYYVPYVHMLDFYSRTRSHLPCTGAPLDPIAYNQPCIEKLPLSKLGIVMNRSCSMYFGHSVCHRGCYKPLELLRDKNTHLSTYSRSSLAFKLLSLNICKEIPTGILIVHC